MTEIELNEMYPEIKIDNKTFTVRYRCTHMTPILNSEKEIIDYEIHGFELLSTPEEMYQLSLKPVEPPIDKMSVRLGQIEQAMGILATQVAKNTLLQNQGGMK